MKRTILCFVVVVSLTSVCAQAFTTSVSERVLLLRFLVGGGQCIENANSI